MRLVGYYTGTPGEALSPGPARRRRQSEPLPGRRRPRSTCLRPPRRHWPMFRRRVNSLPPPRCGCTRSSIPIGGTISICRATFTPAIVRPTWRHCKPALDRFEGVSRDPRYVVLANRVEFRATHEWLERHVSAANATGTARNVPTSAIPPK